MRQLIAGNWKMNGSLTMAGGLANALRAAAADGALPCDLLVCPPATLVTTAAHALQGSPVAVGGQDCHAKTSGAHTGCAIAARRT
jgi:triosephosphate isomerase